MRLRPAAAARLAGMRLRSPCEQFAKG